MRRRTKLKLLSKPMASWTAAWMATSTGSHELSVTDAWWREKHFKTTRRKTITQPVMLLLLFTYKETGSFSSNKNLGWSFPPKTRFSLQTSKNQNSHPPNFVSLEIQKTSQLKNCFFKKGKRHHVNMSEMWSTINAHLFWQQVGTDSGSRFEKR
jgi:hypothetical protein